MINRPSLLLFLVMALAGGRLDAAVDDRTGDITVSIGPLSDKTYYTICIADGTYFRDRTCTDLDVGAGWCTTPGELFRLPTMPCDAAAQAAELCIVERDGDQIPTAEGCDRWLHDDVAVHLRSLRAWGHRERAKEQAREDQEAKDDEPLERGETP